MVENCIPGTAAPLSLRRRQHCLSAHLPWLPPTPALSSCLRCQPPTLTHSPPLREGARGQLSPPKGGAAEWGKVHFASSVSPLKGVLAPRPPAALEFHDEMV